MSVAAMRREIESQPDALARVAGQLASNSLHLPLSRTIFTGSGDSWAAALFAREIAKGKLGAEDPAELSANSVLLKRKYIVLISTSGRTRANLELARKAKSTATRTIAVTSDAKSPLARICDESIILSYATADTLTSGTISFTANLLACSKLLRRLGENLSLKSALLDAEKLALPALLHHRGLCLFVGSGVDRALAEYGACKTREVLGSTAFATYPEQVGHAILFSLDPARDTIVCMDTVGNAKTRELYDRLLRAKFRVWRFRGSGNDSLTSCLAACFWLQFVALLNAERAGQREVAFVQDESRLKLSNKLIY